MADFGSQKTAQLPAPAAASYQANLTIIPDWWDGSPAAQIGTEPDSAMRGQPAPFAWWQRRPRLGPGTVPQPVPMWLQSRPYDRGAQAFSPKFGVINYNPIGSGVYAPYRLPTIAGPGARYAAAAIFFNVQDVPTTIVMNPTIPIETMDALLATAHAGPAYLTTG